MTVATMDDGLTTAERRAAARDAYRASVEAGQPVTGADLGRRFGRTARWGRMQISEARAERVAAASPIPNGNGQRITQAPGPTASKRPTAVTRINRYRRSNLPVPEIGSTALQRMPIARRDRRPSPPTRSQTGCGSRPSSSSRLRS